MCGQKDEVTGFRESQFGRLAPCNPSEAIRVAVVSHSGELLASLRRIFQESSCLRCVAEYGSAHAALARISGIAAQAALIGILLPDMSGLKCAKLLKAMAPHLATVVAIETADRETIDRAVCIGCEACLAMPVSTTQCETAIRWALRKRMMCNDCRTTLICARIADVRRRRAQSLRILTEREKSVMQLLAAGLSSGQCLSARSTGRQFSRVYGSSSLHATQFELSSED